MPFESAKNRMATQKPDPETGELLYKSVLQTVRRVAGQEGVLALWKGFLPNWLRLGPWQFVFWISYEGLRTRATGSGF